MSNILSKKVEVAGCGAIGLPVLRVLRVLLENNIDASGYDTRPKSFFEDLKKITSSIIKQNLSKKTT